MGFARWYRLGVGFLLVAVPLWLLFGRLDAIWNGAPAYPTALFVTVGIGLTTMAFALWPWRREPEPLGPPWEADPDGTGQSGQGGASTGGWPAAGRLAAGVIALLWLGILSWLQPSPTSAAPHSIVVPAVTVGLSAGSTRGC